MSRYGNRITPGTIGTVVRQDGMLLMIQRQKEPFVGKWCMPGGKIELGEHPSEAIVREFREETGLTVEVERFCGVVSELVPSEEDLSHFLLYVFRLRIIDGCVHEHATDEGPLQWWHPSALDGQLIPSDQWMIQHMLCREDGPRLVQLTSSETTSDIVAQYL